jgi:hypothetical protein
LERLNFALALVSNRIPGTRVDLARFAGPAATASGAVDQQRVVDQFLQLVLQGDISPRSREVLTKQLGDRTTAPIASAQASAQAADTRAQTGAMDGPRRGATENAGNEYAGLNRRGQRRNRMRDDAAGTVGNPEVARIAALIIGSPEFQRQ